MHKKPLSSRYPHTIQLASDLGKPVTFLALAGTGAPTDEEHAGICEYAVIVIGPFEHPYGCDGFVNPERRMTPEQLLGTGLSARSVAALPRWPEVWQEGLGNIVSGSLVVGGADIADALALLDAQARRYGLPVSRWDWLNVHELFSRATGRDWNGSLTALGAELGVKMPGLARPMVAEPMLLARIFESTLAAHGDHVVAGCRHLQPAAIESADATAEDPFALTPAPRRPELRLVESPPAPAAEADPFDLALFEGDTIPPMTPFYGGAFTLQELIDAMLDKLVEQGLVKSYADVIGALRGLGFVIEKSKDPYQGVVVDTAIRAKRRLKGRYYRPNFVAAAAGEPVPLPVETTPGERVDVMTRLEKQIREGGYHSLEHQLRLVEPDYPQSTRQTLAYAISMLLDHGRLEHELAADETVQSWLVDAVRPLVRRDGPVLLKPLMTSLIASPHLTRTQQGRLDYVQLRVALHRLGITYPAKKKTG